MASSAYISGRKQYARPQALLWSNNFGTLQNEVYFPIGTEKEDFIILSDHNRSEISISQQRIETRQRMINGTMRSYYIDDKINLSVSWSNLPSRSFSTNTSFSSTGEPILNTGDTEYTVDGGAGGVELLDWYENHSGPFYVYLAYDKYNTFKVSGQVTSESFNNTSIYNEIKLMYFSSFEYNVVKRSGGRFDLWNVSVALEEA